MFVRVEGRFPKKMDLQEVHHWGLNITESDSNLDFFTFQGELSLEWRHDVLRYYPGRGKFSGMFIRLMNWLIDVGGCLSMRRVIEVLITY